MQNKHNYKHLKTKGEPQMFQYAEIAQIVWLKSMMGSVSQN